MRWTRTSLTGKLFLSYMVITVIGVMLLFVAAWEVAPTFLGQQLARTPTHLLPSHTQLEIAFRQALLQALVVATALVLATALVVSLVVSRWIVRPIRRMLAATQHIAAGHYAARVSVGRSTHMMSWARLPPALTSWRAHWSRPSSAAWS